MLILLDFAVNQTTVEFLDDLISKAPQKILDEPLVFNAERFETAQGYIRKVLSSLSGSHRMADLNHHLVNGEWEAEQQIKETPPTDRPADIDQLDLRRWAIANRQCWRFYHYLRRQKDEVKERIRSQRSGLIERLTERNPS